MTRMSKFYRFLLLSVLMLALPSLARAQCGSITITGKLEGCVPYSVGLTFNNTSGKTVATGGYAWDFGDGTSGAGSPNGTATASYQNPGCFTPTLKVTFVDGSVCTVTAPNKVCANSLPKANFSLPSGAGSGAIQCFRNGAGQLNRFCFTNLSTPGIEGNPIVKYYWNFGDGSIDSSTNPCHTYQAPGRYNISLQVIDSKGCINTIVKSAAIVVLEDLDVPFKPIGKTGCGETEYEFKIDKDTTDMWISSFEWDFNDGSPINTTDWNPKHKYTTPGTFKVKLKITNKLGCTATYEQEVKNVDAKLVIRFKDSVCFENNQVCFMAEEIPGATFVMWTFDDIPSGNDNIAINDWAPCHKFVRFPASDPGNFQVRLQVRHPQCGTIDTCIVVHLKGPKANLSLPSPKYPGNTYRPAKPMPLADFIRMNNLSACIQEPIVYSKFQKGSTKTDTIWQYCNTTITQKITDKIEYCDGDKQTYDVKFVEQPSGYRVRTYVDSTELKYTWNPGTPLPSGKIYYPSSGDLVWGNMHDSNNYTCKLPNLVRFTNQSMKYRLYRTVDDDPEPNFDAPSATKWRDTCAWKGWPFASDSMKYLWSFQDPYGKPCTSTVANPDVYCNFSTMTAPYHYYTGDYKVVLNPFTNKLDTFVTYPNNRCQSFTLTVTDDKTGCSSTASEQLRQGSPRATWDTFAYCKMNFDIQKLLPKGDPNPAALKPMRGFIMDKMPLQCAGPEYRFTLNFGETLPTCGAQDYWITFDSAASTKVDCIDPITGKKYLDHGFEGASNASGYLVASPKKVWTNMPWLGKYWYMSGDSGCKTIGIVLENDGCRDTAWYHDYFCFNKLDAHFVINRVNPKTRAQSFVGNSKLPMFGKVCHFPNVSNPGFDTIGVEIKLAPADINQSQITKWLFGVARLDIPSSADYYYSRPFWPDTAQLDTARHTVYSSNYVLDSLTSVERMFITTTDSSIYINLYDKRGTFLGPITVDGLPLEAAELAELNANGNVRLKLDDYRGRPFSLNCGDTMVTVSRYRSSVVIKDTFYVYAPVDNFKADSRFFPGKKVFTRIADGYAFQDTIKQHDTVTFKLPYPGVYLATSGNINMQNCIRQQSFVMIYGHYAQFTTSDGDSILCVGEDVEFNYKVGYFGTVCPPVPGGPPPPACLDEPIFPDPLNSPYSWPMVPFTPWNVKDPIAYRKLDNANTGWTPYPGFRAETIYWNYGDDNTWTAPILGGQPPRHRYSKPGVYTVTMRTMDSTGCIINTKRRNFIKVIGPDANFVSNDTFSICAPKTITMKDLSIMKGSKFKKAVYPRLGKRPVKPVGPPVAPTRPVHPGPGATPGQIAAYNSAYAKYKVDSMSYVTAAGTYYADLSNYNQALAKYKSDSINMPARIAKYKADSTKYAQDSIKAGKYKFAYHETFRKKVNGRPVLVDSLVVVDSIVAWKWDVGDGRPTITRTVSDTAFRIDYPKNGVYSITLSVLTANKPTPCTDVEFKKDYVTILGPRPEFEVLNPNGCFPHTVTIRNKSLTGFEYTWNLGDGTVKVTGPDSIVTLTYQTKAGSFKVSLLQKDSIFDRFLNRYVECSKIYPDVEDSLAKVNVEVYPIPAINIIADTVACPNSEVKFFAQKHGGKYNYYKWDFGDGSTYNGADSVVSHIYKHAGTNLRYTIRVAGFSYHPDDTCETVSTHTLRIDSIKALFHVDTANSQMDLGRFTFVNDSRSVPEVGTTYEWDFGDGTKETRNDKSSVSHDYAATLKRAIEEEDKEGNFEFTVKLTAKSKIGCPDTITRVVKFSRVWKHYNVFTPNGDGKNDVFDPKIKGSVSYSLDVYNRWGERVFTSTDPKVDWNGQNKNTGGECPDGVYYYVWKFKLIGMESIITKTGTVTLIR